MREDPGFLVPAAPLARWLRQIARGNEAPVGSANRAQRGGLRDLARKYAERFGEDDVAAAREIQRIVNPNAKNIRRDTADRWACLIGLHPVLIWPEEWFRGPVLLSRKKAA